MTDPDLPALEHDTATGALSKGPEPFGLHHTYMNSPEPSSVIAKDSLRPIKEVLNNEPGKEILLEKAGTVCQKLAREAIFGSEKSCDVVHQLVQNICPHCRKLNYIN